MSIDMFDADVPAAGRLQIAAVDRQTGAIGDGRLPRTDILEEPEVHLLDYIKVLYKRR